MNETCWQGTEMRVYQGRMWVLDVGPMGGPEVLVTPPGPNPHPICTNRQGGAESG